MMDRDSITRTGARASGAERLYRSHGGSAKELCTLDSEQGRCQPHTLRRTGANRKGRPRLTGQPWSRIGENPPYGILGGTMETSASFEARSAPSSYPTRRNRRRYSLAIDDVARTTQVSFRESVFI